MYLKITEVPYSIPGKRSTVLATSAVADLLEEFIDESASGKYDGGSSGTLASKYWTGPGKKYIVDLVQNPAGRFLRLVEMHPSRGKVSVIFPESCWLQLKRAMSDMVNLFPQFKLTDDIRVFETNPKTTQQADDQPHVLFTKTMAIPQKRFFFDLAENKFGYYLKVSQVNFKKERSTILIPVGLFAPLLALVDSYISKQFKNPIDKLRFVDSEDEDSRLYHSSRNYFFDLRKSNYGRNLRISELAKSGSRSSISIPESCFPGFKQIIQDAFDKTKS